MGCVQWANQWCFRNMVCLHYCHYIRVMHGGEGDQICFRSATWVQVGGFSNGNQRGFRTRDDAQAAWDHALANGTVGRPRPTIPVGVASIPLSSPTHSHGISALDSKTPQTSQSGLAPKHWHASRRLDIPLSPSARTTPQSPGGNRQLPTLSGSSVPHPVISTQCSPMQYRLSDEDAYWVVISGANLGVYHGR
jgi:hypothetical protein